MKFEELLQQSNTLLEIVEKINEQIAKTIVKILKDIIPDLEYSISWADTICFYSDSYSATNMFGYGTIFIIDDRMSIWHLFTGR